ncbi:MAG: CinA family nicotinamide mononucleotide deamidase-related protein [Planctomycetota bacterium]|jgi:nicotinamide-nucleotide amidase
MHAEIIAIGDEITSGQLLDTNTQWLSQRLEELGIRVLYHTTVGDELEPCAGVFRQAIARADVVVATGGLGPTADDLTRQAVAKGAGRELVVDPQALEHVRRVFSRRKRTMAKRNEQQAMIPAGGRMVHNPNGTAPGIYLELPREATGPCRLFALPGVPSEMKEMWYDSVSEQLRKVGAGARIILHRRIKCFGAGESNIEAMLPDLIRRGRKPSVGINASKTTIILRITAEGATEEECHAAMEPTVATIRRNLGRLVFGEDDDELQHAVVRLLRQQDRTLATAEWGTAGLVTQWLDGVAEAEGYYLGGVVAADKKALVSLLRVEAELIERHSLTSGEVARAMAVGCRERFASDYGLAVGRFPRLDAEAAGPSPVSLALATPDGVELKRFPFAGHPATLRIYCAKRALNMVRLRMLESA